MGEAFVGYCTLCGERDLPMSAALRPCPNQRDVSAVDALIDAIEGPDAAIANARGEPTP